MFIVNALSDHLRQHSAYIVEVQNVQLQFVWRYVKVKMGKKFILSTVLMLNLSVIKIKFLFCICNKFAKHFCKINL